MYKKTAFLLIILCSNFSLNFGLQEQIGTDEETNAAVETEATVSLPTVDLATFSKILTIIEEIRSITNSQNQQFEKQSIEQVVALLPEKCNKDAKLTIPVLMASYFNNKAEFDLYFETHQEHKKIFFALVALAMKVMQPAIH